MRTYEKNSISHCKKTGQRVPKLLIRRCLWLLIYEEIYSVGNATEQHSNPADNQKAMRR